MRQELGSGLRRYEDISILVAGILLTAVATPGSVTVMQLEQASRKHFTSSLWLGETSLPDQGADSLERDAHQPVGVDGIAHRAVIGLVLAEGSPKQHQILPS